MLVLKPHNNVRPDCSPWMIRLARFSGTDKLGDFNDNQRAYANAFQIITAALNFTQRHLLFRARLLAENGAN